MKRYSTIIIAVLVTLMLAACEQETMLYNTSDNVYFDYTLQHYDTMQSYTFAYTPDITQDTLYFPVRLSGKRQPYDRKFKLEVYPEYTTATPGDHYEPLNEYYVMQADSGLARVPVIIYNTDPFLEDAPVKLSLKLIPTEDLGTAFSEMLISTATVSNRLEKPDWWDLWGNDLAAYSRTKHALYLIAVGKVDLPAAITPETNGLIPHSLFILDKYRQFLNNPFAWQETNEKGYVLEKRPGENAYDFYTPANPFKVYKLVFDESEGRYYFRDENGNWVKMN